MNKIIFILLTAFLIFGVVEIISLYRKSNDFGAPPYVEDLDSDFDLLSGIGKLDEYSNWERPDGPVRIGLQAGHWKTDEMPEEQARIRDNGGGTTGRGVAEWEVVLEIAKETAKILKEEGYEVDILPSTVPEGYWADAFISIHADGNPNPTVSGYKIASYAKDRTSNADELSDFISEEYRKETGLSIDPNVTRSMTRYYAFNSRRYKHAVHPMTPSVIIETGFMTNYREATLLIDTPEKPAKGIANGIIRFVEHLGIEE